MNNLRKRLDAKRIEHMQVTAKREARSLQDLKPVDLIIAQGAGGRAGMTRGRGGSGSPFAPSKTSLCDD